MDRGRCRGIDSGRGSDGGWGLSRDRSRDKDRVGGRGVSREREV